MYPPWSKCNSFNNSATNSNADRTSGHGHRITCVCTKGKQIRANIKHTFTFTRSIEHSAINCCHTQVYALLPLLFRMISPGAACCSCLPVTKRQKHRIRRSISRRAFRDSIVNIVLICHSVASFLLLFTARKDIQHHILSVCRGNSIAFASTRT